MGFRRERVVYVFEGDFVVVFVVGCGCGFGPSCLVHLPGDHLYFFCFVLFVALIFSNKNTYLRKKKKPKRKTWMVFSLKFVPSFDELVSSF